MLQSRAEPCQLGGATRQPAPLPDSMEKKKGQHLLEHLRHRVWSVPLAYGFSLPNSHLGCTTTKNRIMQSIISLTLHPFLIRFVFNREEFSLGNFIESAVFTVSWE